ncbi:MAG: TrmB family transcriptional regulator [Halobacteriota archaeon]
MSSDSDLIVHLMGFGLTEKEAQCYCCLLKYGAKSPSPLAKSLRTYRMDVHRLLDSLIDKGMVRPSLGSPTVYTAIDLDTALESALKKLESELREMELRKRAIGELVRQQRRHSPEEVGTFKVIKNINELTGVSLAREAAIKEEQLFVFPTKALSIGALAGVTDAFIELAARGVCVRGIVDFSNVDPSQIRVEQARELLDRGVNVRYLDNYHGLYFSVSDRKTCVTVMHVDARSTSLSVPISVIWADDPAYAESLASTFEVLWEKAIPGEEQIQKLMEQGLQRVARY